MIKSFSVTNFKNFRDTLTLDLSNPRDYGFNNELIKDGILNKVIVFGYNASGKSNLGYAIMDITSHLTDNLRGESHYKYPLSLDSGKNEATFRYVFEFNKQEVTYIYRKDVERRLLSEEILLDEKTVFFYDYINNTYSNKLPSYENIDLSRRNENLSIVKFLRNNQITILDNDPIKQIVDFANDMLWFRSLRQNEFIGKLPNGDNIASYIIRNNLAKDFEKFLHECGVDETIEVSDFPSGKVLTVVKGKYSVPFFDIASTGTECLTLFYYWQKSSFDNIRFLYLDEFDAFYHENLSYHLYEIVAKSPSYQTILTTHNSSLATNSLTRPDCVFILKNNKIKPLCDLTSKILREGHNLRKLLEAGEFDEE